MSQEYLEHIFEPFSQEDPGARTTYHGTGLGMSIVHRLVDSLGGTIRVESEKMWEAALFSRFPSSWILLQNHRIRQKMNRRLLIFPACIY